MVQQDSNLLTLGIDLGGTKIAARLCHNEVIIDERFAALPRYGNGEDELNAMLDFLRGFGNLRDKLKGTCIAGAPNVDSNGIVTCWPNRPHWIGIPLKSAVEEVLGATVMICDDGCAAAIADASVLKSKHLIHFSLGTGVGGGVVTSGGLLLPNHTRSTELGHMLVAADGRECTCGRRGCLQAYASTTALQLKAYGQITKKGNEQLRRDYMAKRKDVVLALSSATDKLAVAAVNLIEIFGSDTISFSGGVVEILPELPSKVSQKFAKYHRVGHTQPKFVLSPHLGITSLVGACELALRQPLQKTSR